MCQNLGNPVMLRKDRQKRYRRKLTPEQWNHLNPPGRAHQKSLAAFLLFCSFFSSASCYLSLFTLHFPCLLHSHYKFRSSIKVEMVYTEATGSYNDLTYLNDLYYINILFIFTYLCYSTLFFVFFYCALVYHCTTVSCGPCI